MKTVAIFGGTGTTGTCCVRTAVEKGLEVRMLVRDPARIADELRGKAEVVVGDVLNYQDVLRTLEGADAACVALGTRNSLELSTVMSDGLNNIVRGMEEKKLKILSVCLSAFLFYEPEKVPPQFRNIDADHRRMLEALESSDLDWIAAFPPHIADEPPTEVTIKHGQHPGHRIISKHSLGKFLIDSLDDPQHYKKIVGLANKIN